MMKTDRFENFVLLIESVHKCINKVKQEIILESSIKSVHTLWLYKLLQSPEGLTATEIAAKSGIDRSLVSREIRALIKSGYIVTENEEGKRGYNARITLTEPGKVIAERIAAEALSVQEAVSRDISKDELETFYEVLEKISYNLDGMTEKGK